MNYRHAHVTVVSATKKKKKYSETVGISRINHLSMHYVCVSGIRSANVFVPSLSLSLSLSLTISACLVESLLALPNSFSICLEHFLLLIPVHVFL